MIDLHTHTKHSDGSSTTEELLREAEKIGLTHLSITDHNTIAAYNDLKDYTTRMQFKGKIITGIEITTTYKGETIEILGYNFDLNKMQEFLNKNVLSFEQKQLKEFELIKNSTLYFQIILYKRRIHYDKKEWCTNSRSHCR